MKIPNFRRIFKLRLYTASKALEGKLRDKKSFF